MEFRDYSYYPAPGPASGSGMAVASLVLGLAAMTLFCFVPLSVPVALIGIGLGAACLRRGAPGRGMAIAGISTGAVGLAGALAVVGLFFSMRSAFMRTVRTGATRAQFSSFENRPAPALALTDTQGRLHSLGSYRGRVVMLNFWASG
jgi:hypothetical protein